AAEEAIEQAVGQAAAFDATLHALYVVELQATSPMQLTLDTVIDRLEAEGADRTAEIAEAAESAGVEAVTDVRHGVADETIVDYVRAHDIDLVVMGTHGRRGVDRQLLGSVTERVVRTSPVPVLTVRQPS
ncbi:MAG: universal stress protein, partial [Halobacteriales archaeon]